MADASFASQLQSRMNEKANKVLREAEARDALSHVAHLLIYVICGAQPGAYLVSLCGAQPVGFIDPFEICRYHSCSFVFILKLYLIRY